MFKNIEPVIDAEIIDLKQNNDSMTTYTFNYTIFNKEDESYIEKYIGGIDGKIIWRFGEKLPVFNVFVKSENQNQ